MITTHSFEIDIRTTTSTTTALAPQRMLGARIVIGGNDAVAAARGVLGCGGRFVGSGVVVEERVDGARDEGVRVDVAHEGGEGGHAAADDADVEF